MKAIVYRRVSSDDNETKKGLIDQKQYIEGFLKHRTDIQLIEDIEVDGVSGAEIENNTKLQQLLNKLPTVDGVIVSELDRFVRPKDFGSLTMLRHFEIHNTLIITPGKTYDLNDDDDWFTVYMLVGVAGRERAMISKRTSRGRLRAVNEGVKLGGRNPIGYVRDKNKVMFVFNENKHILEQVIKMVKQGQSFRSVGIKLNISHVGIVGICKNPVLYGKPTASMDGKTYELKSEPLMTKDEFDLLQRIVMKRKYILAGHITNMKTC